MNRVSVLAASLILAPLVAPAPGRALTVAGSLTDEPVTGLSPGETYYYRVRAVNAAGASANSNVEKVTLPRH